MGWYKDANYHPKRDLEKSVREKMKVLQDFYVVDEDNYDEIYEELIRPLRMHPERDIDAALDRAARNLIMGKLGRDV